MSVAFDTPKNFADGPMQYYKPWELLPGDEARINDQVRETEELVSQELSQYDIDHPTSPKDHKSGPDQEVNQEPKESVNTDLIEDGKEKSNGTNSNNIEMLDASPKTSERPEAAKDTGDDGGEVVEGDEDTVIY